MSKRKPTIVTLDCETDPFKNERVPKPFIWGWLTDAGEYLEFADTEKLVEHMRSLTTRHIVYAHNGGFFDYMFLQEHLEADDIMLIKGRLAKARIGKCELRDSYLILPSSLASFEAGKLEFDYTKLEEEVREEHMDEIREYLQADCEALMRIVQAFRAEHGDALTLATAAMKHWQRISDINEREGASGPNYEMFEPYYYGGRCQLFVKPQTIREQLVYIDINSAYPHAMATLNHPTGGRIVIERSLDNVPEGTPYFVTFRGISYGHLPERDIVARYPFGEGTYNVTSWEFETGLELGLIEVHEVLKVLYYEDSINFAPYVNHWFDKRKEAKEMGDKAQEKICKLFLNSLYGKFAANPKEYMKYTIQTDAPGEEWWPAERMQDGRAIWARYLERHEMYFYRLATAASITGAVRAKLMRALAQVEEPLYCDTDSILCRGLGSLTDVGKELGQWDIEMEPIEAHLAGRKLYALKDAKRNTKVSSKGAQLTYRDLEKLVQGKEVNWASEAPTMRLGRAPQFIHRTIAVNTDV